MQAAHVSHRFPVSVKGILACDSQYLLRKNERDEWELIGGKLEPSEEPGACVAREWKEETGFDISTGPLVDAWIYHVAGVDVLLLAYIVFADVIVESIKSPEGSELRWFGLADLQGINMPEGYKRAIAHSVEVRT